MERKDSGEIMMYGYLKFADGTEVTHSHIIKKDGEKTVQVHFERPTDDGFDFARCVLPSYEWIKRKGYSDKEIAFFEEFLQHNAHLLYRFAEDGGIGIA